MNASSAMFHKKSFLLFYSFFVLVFAGCTGMFKKEPTGPRTVIVSVDKRAHDFGIINRSEGAVRDFDIVLENKGNDDLHITEVLKDCERCTQVTFEDSIVAPSSSMTVNVAFDSQAFFDGPIDKGIFIRTNATNEPELEIRFTAELR